MSNLELRAKIAEIAGFTNRKIDNNSGQVFGDLSETLFVKIPEYERDLLSIIEVFHKLKHNWSLSSYYDGESSMFWYSATRLTSEDEYDLEYSSWQSLEIAMCQLLLLIDAEENE